MRTHFVAAVLAVLCLAPMGLIGCSDDTAATEDLASNDLAMVIDGGANGTCASILACAISCSTTACKNTCAAMGSAASQTKFNALFTCAAAACGPSDGGNVDAGAGSCTGPTDTSTTCAACVQAAAVGSACTSEFNACSSS